MAPRNIFASGKDQARGGFDSRKLGGGIQPAATSMISRRPENSVCRRMVPGNISGVSLRGEIVDDNKRVFGMKGQHLERVAGGRP